MTADQIQTIRLTLLYLTDAHKAVNRDLREFKSLVDKLTDEVHTIVTIAKKLDEAS